MATLVYVHTDDASTIFTVNVDQASSATIGTDLARNERALAALERASDLLRPFVRAQRVMVGGAADVATQASGPALPALVPVALAAAPSAPPAPPTTF